MGVGGGVWVGGGGGGGVRSLVGVSQSLPVGSGECSELSEDVSVWVCLM